MCCMGNAYRILIEFQEEKSMKMTSFLGGGYEQFCSILTKDKFWKYTNLIILVIINLMCLRLALYDNFWYDEAYTIGMIQRDFADIIHTTSQDVHPPLYYILLKLFYMFPGMGKLLAAKVFSWIFYLAYLLFGGYICRKHYNRRVEFFWLVLSGFMSPMIVQATSPRMYTMAIFCVTLALYLAYLSVKTEKVGCWIGFGIVSAVTMWLHTFCMIEMFVLYGFLVFWAFFKKKYGTLGKVFLCGVSVSIAYVPWLLILWRQFSRWAGWESGWSNTIDSFGMNSIKDWLAEWFSLLENPSPIVVTCCVMVFVLAGIRALVYAKQTGDFKICAGALFAAIVVVAATIITVAVVPCFLGRYIFPLFGAIYLMVAVGLEQLKRWWIKGLCVLLIIGCGLFAYRGEVMLESPEGLKAYRTYMDANADEDDLIMADTYFLMMMSIYYPENEYMIYGAVPTCMPFEGCEAFTAWEQLEDREVIWYLSFADFKVGGLDEKYEIVDRKDIKFYYYDIVLEKYVIKE